MSKNTTCLLLIIFCCCLVSNASAGASFTNHIEMLESSITFTVNETYTDADALAFREDLDTDDNGTLDTLEIEDFRERYLSNGGAQFLEYIMIDDGALPLTIDSIDIQFVNAQGPVDNSTLSVTTTVQYSMSSVLSAGVHGVWVLGHPLIDNMEFVLPKGMEVVSYDGLDNTSQSVHGGRVVLEGVSGIRSFVIEDKPAFEYAAYVTFQKEPFYKGSFFLPLLVVIEIILASIALYIIKKNKNK
ncbi:hypothetical protein [Methanolobus sp.]|uniref:hypothetical protein n=1 Tax=Methanolobus sp. TaxID=1874737 RepID=UPI0025D461D7|nr:hypothetical protein [Methanolobus sp.]